MAIKESISADQLRLILRYDEASGNFTHNRSIGKTRAGNIAGNSSHPRGYVAIRVKYKKYYAHRLAWLYVHGCWPDGEIDHINGITSDNRIDNLRVVGRIKNMQNLHVIRNKHGSPGVVFNKKTGRYHATIKIDKKATSLGYFNTPSEAGAAYWNAKRVRDCLETT